MDTIRPKIQEQTVTGVTMEPTDDNFNAVNPESIEALKYLGMTDSLYDEDVMDKVSEIIEFTGSGDLQDIDIKLGNPHGLSRLDKIYSYIRLMKQSVALQQKEAMLHQEREKYTRGTI